MKNETNKDEQPTRHEIVANLAYLINEQAALLKIQGENDAAAFFADIILSSSCRHQAMNPYINEQAAKRVAALLVLSEGDYNPFI